jgi:hypothetical protein
MENHVTLNQTHTGGERLYEDFAALIIKVPPTAELPFPGPFEGTIKSAVIPDAGRVHLRATTLPVIPEILPDGLVISRAYGFSTITVTVREGIHLVGAIPEPAIAYMALELHGLLNGNLVAENHYPPDVSSAYARVTPQVLSSLGVPFTGPFFSYNFRNTGCSVAPLPHTEVCHEGVLIGTTLLVPFPISDQERDFTILNTITAQATLGAWVDMSHTATMSLVLPPGVTFTSDSGIFLTEQDIDGDGVLTIEDNCPAIANGDQADADGDGVGDACDTDYDNDGVVDDDDNCLETANAAQEDTDGDGVGDVCEHDRTLCSWLGNDPRPSLLDQDIFTFTGTAGEHVTIQVDKAPGGVHTGERITLLMTDKIKRVFLFRADSSVLPNEITATLPKTGEYLIMLTEQPRLLSPKRFRGDYCVTLEASGDAAGTLDATAWVE